MSTVRLRIDSDEWYPVHSVIARDDAMFGVEVEVEQDRADWWKRSLDDFTEAQADMQAAMDEAHTRKINRTIAAS
jgi:hypothetical protein